MLSTQKMVAPFLLTSSGKYYSGEKYSKDIDPRIMNSVEKMTLDILRPLYYK
jgi:hypothetical protein